MNECSLGVHEIEFMVESRPNLGNVGARYCSWRLVVDTDLESGGTPIDKLDRS